jgi:hypothetical protein
LSFGSVAVASAAPIACPPFTAAPAKGVNELATAEQGEDPAQRQLEADWAELTVLRRKVQKAAENVALFDNPEERGAVAAAFRELRDQAALEQRVAARHSADRSAAPGRSRPRRPRPAVPVSRRR